MSHRIFGMPFADIYALYLAKVERKGHSQAELDQVIEDMKKTEKERSR